MRLQNSFTLNYMHSAFSSPFCAFLCPLVTTARGFLAQMVTNKATWLNGTVAHAVTGSITSCISAAFYFCFIDASASGSGQVPGGVGTNLPFVNLPFEWDIHGTVNFTTFCCVLRVTWCHRVRFSCYLRPKRGPTSVCKLEVLSSHMVQHIR